MHIGIGTICAILFILLLIAIFVGLSIAVKYRNTKNKYNRQRSETAQWQNNCNRIDTQFTGLTTQIAQEEALKKEVEKRRRVTQKTKNAVLERDNKVCQICGISYNFVEELCTGLGDYLLFEIDHIQSVAQGGTGSETDNLQCLCWRCNRKKGGKKTNEEVLQLIDYGADKLVPRYKPLGTGNAEENK